jgi:hypothetical protein
VDQFRGLLGAEPSFVDRDRWAQFDYGGQRVALAGKDKLTKVPSLMIKVNDVAQARLLAIARGMSVGEVQTGLHELHCTVAGPGGWPIVFYAPLKE